MNMLFNLIQSLLKWVRRYVAYACRVVQKGIAMLFKFNNAVMARKKSIISELANEANDGVVTSDDLLNVLVEANAQINVLTSIVLNMISTEERSPNEVTTNEEEEKEEN